MPASENKPATKSDLKKVETALKGDIEAVEAKLKGEIQSVKTELNKKIDKVAMELVRTQADVREIKETMATKMATKEDVSKILTAIDRFAGKAEGYDRAAVLHGKSLTEHEIRISDHDKRLVRLESGPN